jgi:alpha-beta hydrolase superfamily lysophospholipase
MGLVTTGFPMHKVLSQSLAAILALCNLAPALAATTYEEQSDLGVKLNIPVHQWTDNDVPAKGIVVAQQGLIFSGRSYGALARHLAQQGYIVYANDMRGFGGWRRLGQSFNGDSKIHFGQSKDDLTDMLQVLRDSHCNLPIFCIGESFGANLAVWEASTNPELVDGVIAASAGSMVHVHPRWIWFKTLVQGLSGPYKNDINIEPYVRPILSEDKTLTRELLSSPECVTRMSVANLIKAAVTNRRSVREIEKIPGEMPMLFLNGQKDKVEVTSVLTKMLHRAGSRDVTQIIFPRKGHMFLEGERLDPVVVARLDKWLTQKQDAYEQRHGAMLVADKLQMRIDLHK